MQRKPAHCHISNFGLIGAELTKLLLSRKKSKKYPEKIRNRQTIVMAADSVNCYNIGQEG